MSITPLKVLAGLVMAGALTLAGALPASAHVPPGPGGHGTPSICVPVPGAKHAPPHGGPGYGFTGGPPASDRAYEQVTCPSPTS